MTSEPSSRTLLVPPEARGERLDRFLSTRLEPEGLSRSRLKALIEEGQILVDGATARAATKLRGGETVVVNIPAPKATELVPEDIPLEVLYEDDWLVVINKPPGMVVHPARGAEEGTLVHALLYQVDDLSGIGGEERPGIVHRLDKETSGVLVVAKHDQAHHGLTDQFKDHSITRRYRALVRGAPPKPAGRWESELGRSPHNRLKMMSLKKGGRRAITDYQVLRALPGASLLELTLHTGRTHQIRVHCSEAGCPVLNDEVYGGHWRRGLPDDPQVEDALASVAPGRQLLHARQLGFNHPKDGRYLEFIAEPPADFMRVLEALVAVQESAEERPREATHQSRAGRSGSGYDDPAAPVAASVRTVRKPYNPLDDD